MDLSDDLVRELRALVDKEQLVQLTLRYATAIDTKDWDLFRSCFTDDVVVQYHQPGQGELVGPDAVVAFMRAGIEPMRVTQHFVTNHVITVDGDEAQGVCYVAAQHRRKGVAGGDLFLVAGSYHDRFRRTPDGWRIARRDAKGAWTAGNRAVAFDI